MRLWTLKELAESGPIRKSIATWRRMIRDKKVTATRVGSGRGMIYISDAELRRLIKSDQM